MPCTLKQLQDLESAAAAHATGACANMQTREIKTALYIQHTHHKHGNMHALVATFSCRFNMSRASQRHSSFTTDSHVWSADVRLQSSCSRPPSNTTVLACCHQRVAVCRCITLPPCVKAAAAGAFRTWQTSLTTEPTGKPCSSPRGSIPKTSTTKSKLSKTGERTEARCPRC